MIYKDCDFTNSLLIFYLTKLNSSFYFFFLILICDEILNILDSKKNFCRQLLCNVKKNKYIEIRQLYKYNFLLPGARKKNI